MIEMDQVDKKGGFVRQNAGTRDRKHSHSSG